MAASALTINAQVLSLPQDVKATQTKMMKEYASVYAKSSRMKAPAASWQLYCDKGVGMYSAGITEDMRTYKVSLSISAGNMPAKLIYLSSEKPESVKWTYLDNSNNLAEFPTDENGNAVIKTFGMYNYPTVEGVYNGETVKYERKYDELCKADDCYLYSLFNHEFAISMADVPFSGGYYGRFDETHLFGKGMVNDEGEKLTGAFSLFSKTTSPMIISEVFVPLCIIDSNNAPMPEGESLSIEIWSVDKDLNFVDKLGAATATSDALVSSDQQGFYNLPVKFQGEDEFGLPYDAPVTVPADTEFAVVVRNLDKVNVSVMFSSANGLPNGTAYTLFGDKVGTIGYSNQPETPQAHLAISLVADMPSAMWQDLAMTVPSAGGKATTEGGYDYTVLYTTTPIYDETSGELLYSISAPDWVTVAEPVVYEGPQGGWDAYRAYILEFSADALPAGETGRQGVVTVTCPGGVQKSVEIGQGDWTAVSVENVETADASVVVAGDSFQLTYGDEYTSVDVYNVAGAKVASYALPQGGSFEVPAADFSGVYMVVFQGAKNTTVKVVK